ncbi:hypothetical protein EJB05_26097, partial [Eragrostis curvula]
SARLPHRLPRPSTTPLLATHFDPLATPPRFADSGCRQSPAPPLRGFSVPLPALLVLLVKDYEPGLLRQVFLLALPAVATVSSDDGPELRGTIRVMSSYSKSEDQPAARWVRPEFSSGMAKAENVQYEPKPEDLFLDGPNTNPGDQPSKIPVCEMF